jgi:hypothetical protein
MTDTIKQAMTLDDLRARRDEILRLAEQHGASNVRVFGSVARGDARPDSDVDIVVEFPARKSIFDLVGLWLDITELIGVDVSLLTDEALEGEFKTNVERDAVPL